MRFLNILLFIVIYSLQLTAQVVTSEPVYATRNDSIIIYFHADQGDKGLMGYTGTDVYAHTGVITNKSTSPSDWKYVVTPWPPNTGANTAKNNLTKISTDLWKLVIAYPYTYYGVPQADIIQKLAFVFRNGDGSKTGRDVGGADIFYVLYEPGITAVLIDPQVEAPYGDPERSPKFLDPGESLTIHATAAAIGTGVDSLILTLDGDVVARTAEDTLMYVFEAEDAGFRDFVLTAEGTGGETDTEVFTVFVDPLEIDEDLPDGVIDGINYHPDYFTVTLSLFAPYKKNVYVLGDFNDWKIDLNYKMHRDSVDADSINWWLTLNNLSPGTEYAFQYLVDGEIRIADPYTEKVLDPWNDSYIPSQTYPNLKPYPSGKTDHVVSVLQTAQTVYEWQTMDFVRPPETELVIYELLVRDFIAAHNYQTLDDTLRYLKNLGVTAVELMPVNEFEGNESWGYNPSFYFAPDKYYGSANALRAFIDACHAESLAVIVDMVLNHSYGQSPFVRLYNEGEYGDPTDDNPWYNVTSPNPVYAWGMDFNHESIATQRLVDRINHYWLTQFNVDGFRFDFTKGFTNKAGDGWAYDASRITILKRMADQIWQVSPDAYVILEHFAENTEEKVLSDYGLMLWGNSNHNYNEASMGWNDGSDSDFSWGFYKSRGWSKPHLVTYMESHDEERLMYKNLQYGNSSGEYSVKDLNTSIARMKMTFAFFLTQPGPKMIWQFGELGYDISIEYNGRVGNKPIRWDYYQQSERRRLYKTISALLKLRRENPIFRSSASTASLSLSGAAKRMNISYSSMSATIIGNFGVTTTSVNPNFQHSGSWYDFFSGDTITVVSNTEPITLDPGEFHIYTDVKVNSPEEDLISGLQEFPNNQIPIQFDLLQNYPNPFNSSTVIEYTVGSDQQPLTKVELAVYNLLGQRVETLISEYQSPGRYSVRWNAQNLSGGLYIIRMSDGESVLYKKTLLVK